MERKSMNIVIVGGSLAGLMHGIMLKRQGHNVHILEKTRESVRSGEAAGIRAGKEVEQFFQKYDLLRQPYFFDCPGLKFIDKESRQKRFIKYPMCMTSWTALYYRLRANFDGFSSEHCPNPPTSTEQDGKAVYDLGKRVTMVAYRNASVVLSFDDDINGGSESICADLVIAADGSNSVLRKFLVPELRRPYAGYVAWRGSVLEKDVSEKSKNVFENKLAVFKMPRNYILMYTIPGKAGSLEPGGRLLNFVWYYNCLETSQEFADIMTDSDGHRHRNTLPPGKIRAEVWDKQKAYAQTVLAPPFVELIEKTTQPFISSVSDAIAPRASFFDGKLLLVGDALALYRPHVALSANQAAMNCLLLEKVMKGEMKLAEWERQVLEYGTVTRLLSILAGDFSQFGGLKFARSVVRYCLALAWQQLGRLWRRL